MAVTMKQVLALLDVDEPVYAEAAELGAGALVHVEALIEGPDPMLASKAAFLAGMIRSDKAVSVLKKALRYPDPRVRIAVAATAANLPKAAANAMLLDLVGDKDVGVRKTAVKAVKDADAKLKARLKALSTGDPDHTVRTISGDRLRKLEQR
jgi:HEAT repeat protein